MRDTSKIDLFSVGRRSFPNWETVCQIEGELATNSLINISQSELDYAEKHRASRLSELIAEENDSGIVYFCERYWLESFPIHRLPYNRWIADQFEVYRKEEELLNNEETKFIHLDFRLFVLPPLLSDDIKSWIDYQGIGPKCTICCDATIDVNYDWYVQATHLMHNVNYYLEMLSEVVTAWEGGRGDDICSLAYIHLIPEEEKPLFVSYERNPFSKKCGKIKKRMVRAGFRAATIESLKSTLISYVRNNRSTKLSWERMSVRSAKD